MKENRFTKGIGLVAKVVLVGGSAALLGAACWKGVGMNVNVGGENGNISLNENVNTVAENVNAEVNGNVNTSTNTNSTGEIDTSDWLTYTNEEYGFSFRYPESLPLAVDQPESSELLDFNFFFIKVVSNNENLSLDQWVKKHVNVNQKLDLTETVTTGGIQMQNVVKSFELDDFGEYPGTQTYFADPTTQNIFLIGYLQDKTILQRYGYDDSILGDIINSIEFVK